jgi:hypothetical protein
MSGRGTRGAAAECWTPRHPVPWPATGDPRLDLLRAAVEARLYPYGDLVSSPGRCIATYQLSLLERGRVEGMDDRQVGTFLSANLACGLTTVYRRDESGLQPVGSAVLSGRWGPPDVMGRSEFFWMAEVRSLPDGAGARWEAGELCAAFRRAFGVPFRDLTPSAPAARWENGQGLLF